MNHREFIKNNLLDKLYLINHAFILCKLGSKNNKFKIILLVLFLILIGLTETIPIIMVIPFITIIGDPERVMDFPKISKISALLNISDPNDLLLPFLLLFIGFVSINSYLRIRIISFIFFVKASIAHTLSKSAFEKILLSTYEFQISTNSSSILNDFNNSLGASIAYIETFLNMIKDLLFLVFIICTLFIINKNLTFILFIIALSTYLFTSYKKNKLIKQQGRISKVSSLKRIKIIQESLGSMKNIILENNQNLFNKKYSYYSRKYLFSGAKITAELTKPKYLIEGIFISIIGISAYFFKTKLGINPIPTIGSLALGFQKLLPSVNGLFMSYSAMIARYEQSCKSVDLITKTPQDLLSPINKNNLSLSFKKLELKNISYSYPNSKKKIIKECSLIIKKGETIGIKGRTGSGKSTLINLIMGLMKPTEGTISVNGVNINKSENENTLIAWRKSISHVPQFIYLSDNSIIENIAFGEKLQAIDYERAEIACKTARIFDFINKSEKGLYTKVGERGIKLSGGQLQRIGIARALYRNSDILILDEATSALDQITEKEVIDSLKTHNKDLTIISISHRLSTLVGYDRILRFSNKSVFNEDLDKNL